MNPTFTYPFFVFILLNLPFRTIFAQPSTPGELEDAPCTCLEQQPARLLTVAAPELKDDMQENLFSPLGSRSIVTGISQKLSDGLKKNGCFNVIQTDKENGDVTEAKAQILVRGGVTGFSEIEVGGGLLSALGANVLWKATVSLYIEVIDNKKGKILASKTLLKENFKIGQKSSNLAKESFFQSKAMENAIAQVIHEAVCAITDTKKYFSSKSLSQAIPSNTSSNRFLSPQIHTRNFREGIIPVTIQLQARSRWTSQTYKKPPNFL